MSILVNSNHHQLGATLLAEVDLLRIDADRKLTPKRRSELGQFFTSGAIARSMARMLQCHAPDVRLLDAGAGVGSLLSAAVAELCSRIEPPRSISVTAYEIDATLTTYLSTTLNLCAQACAVAGIDFHSEIRTTDFVEEVSSHLATPLFSTDLAQYTCAILNPPYRKIRTNSSTRHYLSLAGIETSNLYTGFLGLAIQLLEPGGELVAITPRSFCNGPYFRPFRTQLLTTMALQEIHVFEKRDTAFSDNEVLQENIIFAAVKSKEIPATIRILSSISPDDEMPVVQEVPYTTVIRPKDPEQFIHLVTNATDQDIASIVLSLPASLTDLGITVSTGRVVDFRATNYLRAEPGEDTVPLIYPTHLQNGLVVWPKQGSRKPNALVQCAQTRDLLVPNDHYVLVRRFTAKEERRRVVAALNDPAHVSGTYIGFENHLNYFHENGKGLDPILARGLMVYLNSTLVDLYFRQFNGHTQVNATDLRSLRYPDREQLCSLGIKAGNIIPSQVEIDDLVSEALMTTG